MNERLPIAFTGGAGPASGTVVSWRTERLIAAGLPGLLARSIAADCAYDLHELLTLVDRGCPARLAARILAPLDRSERPG